MRANPQEVNRHVLKCEAREHLNCPICPPNRGENSKRGSGKRNHGQKPKRNRRPGR